MPKGPKGEKRPADVIGNAVHVMRIATGEEAETPAKSAPRSAAGKKGGAARAKALSPAKRKAIAHKGVKARQANRRAAKTPV